MNYRATLIGLLFTFLTLIPYFGVIFVSIGVAIFTFPIRAIFQNYEDNALIITGIISLLIIWAVLFTVYRYIKKGRYLKFEHVILVNIIIFGYIFTFILMFYYFYFLNNRENYDSPFHAYYFSFLNKSRVFGAFVFPIIGTLIDIRSRKLK